MNTNAELLEKDDVLQSKFSVLLIGEPSIQLPELAIALEDGNAKVYRICANPSVESNFRGTFRTINQYVEHGSISVVYSDNDITKFYNTEGRDYFETVFKIMQPGGVFVCSFIDSCSFISLSSGGDLTIPMTISDGVELSIIEMVYGEKLGMTGANLFDVRNSLYNGQMIGELAASIGFKTATVFSVSSSFLVLIATKDGDCSNLPEGFRAWVREGMDDAASSSGDGV